jgi:hypothetical protein
MKPDYLQMFKEAMTTLMAWLKLAFDKTASWVTTLSWWKFILISILILVAGNILQEILFPPQSNFVVMDRQGKKSGHKTINDRDTDIRIDANGIYIRKSKEAQEAAKQAADAHKKAEAELKNAMPPSPAMPAMPAKPAKPAKPARAEDAEAPDAPEAPETPEPPEKESSTTMDGEFYIKLPPEIGKEVSDAIDEAVDDAAAQKAESYRKETSTWFMNFVLLFLVGLFATKALMGGKKRAETLAVSARENAEREALQRQVSEAKMQMMQAQVEPHFLFNTLASVEHLIETDPPRAAAMQRRLIQYLRAVLPQMRGPGTITNLGREADMVSAYLDLLKMRMEERLAVEFTIPDGLRSAAFPPMMLQSLVENAIKHGLEGKAEGGTLKVCAEVVNGKLHVVVSDDGLGFGALPSDGTGLGLQSIRERLKLLHSGQSQLIIAPNQPSGVRATIEVPYVVTNE